MTPFRTSLTARVVSLSIAFALVGSGLVPIVGGGAGMLTAVFLLAVLGCLVGCVLGVHEHTGPVLVLALTLPLALWPFTLVALLVATRYGRYGWALVAAGALMAAATAIASFTTRAAQAPARRTVEEHAA